jgi:hypothetical protein
LYQVVHTDDQSTEETRTSQASRPVTSQASRHTKEKKKKDSKEKESCMHEPCDSSECLLQHEQGEDAIVSEKPKSKERDRIFEGVALIAFGINVEDEKQSEALKANRPRINKIVSLLKKVGATPESLWAFKKWYTAKYPNASVPNDLAKFSKHYNDYTRQPSVVRFAPTMSVIPVQSTVSDSQQADALAILQAGRNGGLVNVSA